MVALRANRHGSVGLVAEIMDAMDWYCLEPWCFHCLEKKGLRDDIRPFWTVN
jgi:hypothetical protein